MGNALELLHLKKTIPNSLEVFFDVDVQLEEKPVQLSLQTILFSQKCPN